MLEFVFWDVQHGSAAYFGTPNGRNFVVDLGTGSYGSASRGSSGEFSPLAHLKNNCGVAKLDGVIITHPHRDHLDDIFAFDSMNPGVLIRPKHLPDDDVRAGNRAVDRRVIDKYLEVNSRYNSSLSPGEDPFDSANSGGVNFTFFSPHSATTTDLNNHSITAVVEYARSKILITGDNGAAAWNELLGQGAFTGAIQGTDILLAAHHGRESGFSPDLFKHIQPYLTVVSDGRFCDTSATDRYTKQSRGWTVKSRKSGRTDKRFCLTTRNDGVIVVKCGLNDDSRPFMAVEIE